MRKIDLTIRRIIGLIEKNCVIISRQDRRKKLNQIKTESNLKTKKNTSGFRKNNINNVINK